MTMIVLFALSAFANPDDPTADEAVDQAQAVFDEVAVCEGPDDPVCSLDGIGPAVNCEYELVLAVMFQHCGMRGVSDYYVAPEVGCDPYYQVYHPMGWGTWPSLGAFAAAHPCPVGPPDPPSDT